MSEAGKAKESSRAAFEAKRRECCSFLRSVGEVRGGEFHFRKPFGQLRVWLVRRSDFTGQIACWRAAHAKREDKLAVDAIQQQRVAVLCGDGNNVHMLAVARDRREVRRSGNISIPKVVRNFLKMPEALASSGIQCDQA